MEVTYHGKQYKVIDFARSTVLPEEFILLQGNGEYLVAPTHDFSGLTFPDQIIKEAEQWVRERV